MNHLKKHFSKSGFALCFCLVAFFLFPRQALAELTTPFQISVGTPIQIFDPEENVAGLRINIVWGINQKVYGLDVGMLNISDTTIGLGIGALSNVVREGQIRSGGFLLTAGANFIDSDFYGILIGPVFNYSHGMFGPQFTGGVNISDEGFFQISGIANFAGEYFYGIQFTGGVNLVFDEFAGFQFAGLANWADHNAGGIQISGAFNFAEALYGPQISGGVNVSETGFFQVSGLANVTFDDFYGIQATGLVNVTTDDLSGIQTSGLANWTSGNFHGIQLSGIVNYAEDMYGPQLAVGVNLSEHGFFQLSGLSNCASDHFFGIQTTGGINLADRTLRGIQLSGLFNRAGRMYGPQFSGGINISNDSSFQIAGLSNVSGGSAAGLQMTGGANIVGSERNFRSEQSHVSDFTGFQFAGMVNVNYTDRTRALQISGLTNMNLPERHPSRPTFGPEGHQRRPGHHPDNMPPAQQTQQPQTPEPTEEKLTNRFHGLQIGGLFNWNDDVTSGAQLSGLFNVSGKNNGLQFTLGLNFADDAGLQFGLTGNAADAVGVFQFTSGVNYASRSVNGLQFSGLGNHAGGTLTGLQFSGILNLSNDDVYGLQISGLGNRSRGSVVGAQVGFFNRASQVKGVQIGVLNYCDYMSGIQIGLLNIIRNGPVRALPIFNISGTFGQAPPEPPSQRLHGTPTETAPGIYEEQPEIIHEIITVPEPVVIQEPIAIPEQPQTVASEPEPAPIVSADPQEPVQQPTDEAQTNEEPTDQSSDETEETQPDATDAPEEEQETPRNELG